MHAGQLDKFERYLVEEFYDDYREGLISRRTFTRRVAFITGSMAITASAMLALGCSPDEMPSADEPMPQPTAQALQVVAATPQPSAAALARTAAIPRSTAAQPQPTTVAPVPIPTTVQPTAAATQPPAGAPPSPAATTPAPPAPPPASATPSQGASLPAGTPPPPPPGRSPFSVAEQDPSVIAQPVNFPSGSEQIAGYLARPAVDGTYPAVLVCHENRGLTDHIRDVARRFAKAGYVALAIDLLAREGGTAALDSDAVGGALTRPGAARHVADFQAGITFVQTLATVAGDRIGMTGYCFGGGITWQAATAIPELKAAVPFYGSAPELSSVKNIKAAVLGVYAELDSRINAGIDPLRRALAEAAVVHDLRIYPGVNHAFHNDTGARYIEAQASQAWRDTLAWFAQYL